MAGEYNSLKSAWHYVRDGGLPSAPKQVQFIISDLCNQSCSFCAFRQDGYTSNELFVGSSELAKVGHNNPIRMVDKMRALTLLHEMKDAGVLAIQFTGGGEPTVHPNHCKLFMEALDLGFKVALVSNGYRWSDMLINDIIPNMSWVRVSLDAGNHDTYARIRETPIAAFRKVLSHVARASASITRTKSKCVLGVSYVVTPENIDEIITAAQEARDHGAAYIRYTAMFSLKNEKIYDASMVGRIGMFLAMAKRQYETSRFAVQDGFAERFRQLHQGNPKQKLCAQQYYEGYIGGDLMLYRCCALAYNSKGGLQAVTNKSFQTAWSQALNNFQHFDARSCERCPFDDKNRVIDYLHKQSPQHIEFP